MKRQAGAFILGLGTLIAGCGQSGGQGGSGGGPAAAAGASVPKVIEAAKAVFKEMGIAEAGAGIAPVSEVYGILVGKVAGGSRVQVIANKRGAQAEITVTTDGPEDPALRDKVLAAIKARLP